MGHHCHHSSSMLQAHTDVKNVCPALHSRQNKREQKVYPIRLCQKHMAVTVSQPLFIFHNNKNAVSKSIELGQTCNNFFFKEEVQVGSLCCYYCLNGLTPV